MKKRKGFTLIELLGVLIILAVIALIATPIIINVMSQSKKKANEDSAYGIISSAGYYYASGLFDENTVKYDENILQELKYSGSKPKEGSLVYVNTDGQVAVALLYGETCYQKNYEEEKVKEVKIKECKIGDVVVNPTPDEPNPDNPSESSGNLSQIIKNVPLVKHGDGLYKTGEYEYRYRGKQVNNYIKIGSEMYRIIAVDDQRVKVVTEGKLAKTMAFDSSNQYNSSTFCEPPSSGYTYWGCSIYAGDPNVYYTYPYNNITKSGRLDYSSSLYTYLNTTGKDVSLLQLQEKAILTVWNLGPIPREKNSNISTVRIMEEEYKTTFKIGLPSVVDFVIGSTDDSCQRNAFDFNYNSSANCKYDNWLYENNDSYWLANGSFPSIINTWFVDPTGYLNQDTAVSLKLVRPTAYLSNSIAIHSGNGTKDNPYIIQ